MSYVLAHNGCMCKSFFLYRPKTCQPGVKSYNSVAIIPQMSWTFLQARCYPRSKKIATSYWRLLQYNVRTNIMNTIFGRVLGRWCIVSRISYILRSCVFRKRYNDIQVVPLHIYMSVPHTWRFLRRSYRSQVSQVLSYTQVRLVSCYDAAKKWNSYRVSFSLC
jgi:hypothetical protein